MMELEKKLAEADLSAYAINKKDNKLYSLVLDIFRHQNYSYRITWSKIKDKYKDLYSENSLYAIIISLSQYIKSGRKRAGLKKQLMRYADELIEQHVQPYKLPKDEEKVIYKRKERVAIQHTDNAPKQLTTPFKYGILLGNTVSLFNTEAEVNAMKQGLAMGNVSFKEVHITISEVE